MWQCFLQDLTWTYLLGSDVLLLGNALVDYMVGFKAKQVDSACAFV